MKTTEELLGQSRAKSTKTTEELLGQSRAKSTKTTEELLGKESNLYEDSFPAMVARDLERTSDRYINHMKTAPRILKKRVDAIKPSIDEAKRQVGAVLKTTKDVIRGEPEAVERAFSKWEGGITKVEEGINEKLYEAYPFEHSPKITKPTEAATKMLEGMANLVTGKPKEIFEAGQNVAPLALMQARPSVIGGIGMGSAITTLAKRGILTNAINVLEKRLIKQGYKASDVSKIIRRIKSFSKSKQGFAKDKGTMTFEQDFTPEGAIAANWKARFQKIPKYAEPTVPKGSPKLLEAPKTWQKPPQNVVDRVKATTEEAGAKFKGIQEGYPAEGNFPAEKPLVLFDEPTGSTLAVPIDKFSKAAVVDKLTKFRDTQYRPAEGFKGGILPPKPSAVKPTSSLESEALKYKTAEEFVNSRGDKLYHATKDQSDIRGGNILHLSKERGFSENYINDRGWDTAEIKEYYIPKSKIFNIANDEHLRLLEKKLPDNLHIVDNYGMGKDVNKTEFIGYLKNPKMQWNGLHTFTGVPKIIKSLGFDGYMYKERGFNNISIFNPKQALTKSQLTDIWNKAHKAPIAEEGPRIRPLETYKRDIAHIKDVLTRKMKKTVGEGYLGFNKGISGTSKNLLKSIEKLEQGKPLSKAQERDLRNTIESKREYDLSGAEQLRLEQVAERVNREERIAWERANLGQWESPVSGKLQGPVQEWYREPELLETKAIDSLKDMITQQSLPKGSKLSTLIKAQSRIREQVKWGKITRVEANRRIAVLNRRIKAVAEREGLATKVAKNGKISAILRKSGAVVSKEAQDYPHYIDINDNWGLGTPLRVLQEIGGKVKDKTKALFRKGASPVETDVLWRTEDYEMAKHKYLREAFDEVKAIFGKTKIYSHEDNLITEALRAVTNKNLNYPAETIAKKINTRFVDPSVSHPTDIVRAVEKAIKLRKLYNRLLKEQNEIRKMMNMKEIPESYGYSPEIMRDFSIIERLKNEKVSIQDSLGKNRETVDLLFSPNAPINPRAMAKKGGLKYEDRVHSSLELIQNYLITAANDMYNTPIIQNNKAFAQMLREKGFGNSAQFIEEWTAESFAGRKASLDIAAKAPGWARDAMKRWNRVRNMAVFPMNLSWNLYTQPSSMALTAQKTGIVNTVKGFFAWEFNPKVRAKANEEVYALFMKKLKSPTMQDVSTAGVDKPYKTGSEIAESWAGIVGSLIEEHLAGISYKAGIFKGRQLGYKGKALERFASTIVEKTQSMYGQTRLSALGRSETAKSFFPYNTFNVEVLGNIKEFFGKTGTPPEDMIDRLAQLANFTIAAGAFSIIAKEGANKDIWTLNSPPLPLAQFWAKPLMGALSGNYGPSQGTVSIVKIGEDISVAIRNILEVGDWSKMRKIVSTYGPSLFGIPGGVQASRIIETLLAMSREGVVRQKAGGKGQIGKTAYVLSSPEDYAKSFISGPWASDAAKRYMRKKEGLPPEKSISQSASEFIDRFLTK